MRVALIHDWLLSEGGAEKVLEQLAHMFSAPIFTLLYDPLRLNNSFLSSQEIHTSFLQKLPFSHKIHRFLLPLFPYAIEKMDVSFADVIISSSHAVAKGIKKRKGQFHICYCHTPMRYAWDLKKEYIETLPKLTRPLASILLERIRKWDKRNSGDVDLFIANSSYVAKRIKNNYGRESTVIYPPVAVDDFFLSDQKEDYYITHCRLVPYKRVDLIIKTFASMPDKKLIVVGEGPEKHRLEQLASVNVQFTGFIPKKELSHLLSKAKAYVFAAEEDFGIAVIEAQASGLPVIALEKGGAMETVSSGKTGLFFSEPTPLHCKQAIERFEKIENSFDKSYIRKQALSYNEERFKAEFFKALATTP